LKKIKNENSKKTKKMANELFFGEVWIDADKLKFEYAKLPVKADGILVARTRLPINKSQENDLLKEIISAAVLANTGASVYLIPRIKRPDGSGYLPGPDAIVNGQLFEFKVVTGTIRRIEDRFRESRTQGENVYIRIVNPEITRQDVIRKLTGIINDKRYTGGYEGTIVFTVGTGRNEKTYFLKIKDLKR